MEQMTKYRHTMILGNSYTRGYRVAIHSFASTDEPPPDLKPELRMLKGLNASLHSVVTDSPEWGSVSRTDPYFTEVIEVRDIQEFIDAVNEDETLSEADVRTYLDATFGVSELDMPIILKRCNDACIETLGSPLYDPLKKDCPTAHIRDGSIASNRIVASDNGWERRHIIDSVMNAWNDGIEHASNKVE